MAYDYRKLRGRIIEMFGTISAFSRAMHKSGRTISLKLNGKINFDQDEIVMACDLLEIPVGEAHNYFFTLKVQ